MLGGFDERCAADLSNVGEGRGLSRGALAWLTQAVVGAVRPNRDKPLWDLAHLLAALALLGPADGNAAGRADVIDLVLDPRLTGADALATALGGRAPAGRDGVRASVDDLGLVLALDGTPPWRATWSGVARLLSLAEFALTAEDLAHFGTLSGWIGELVEGAGPSREGIDLLVRRLARHFAAYRQAHLPLAPIEKRFRAILTYVGARAGGVDDEAIVAYWEAEIGAGERPLFRTVVEHFITYESACAALGGLSGLAAATSLDALPGWADRLDAEEALSGAITGDDEAAPALAEALAGLPDQPKILTGAERDEIAETVALEPYHRTRPLTALRAVSFGRVQSGIANRLRRGSGGPDVAERAACADADPYEALAERAAELGRHLDRMLRIAAALRLTPTQREALDETVRAALAAAEADLRRVRRAGFDADRDALADAFAAHDETLARATVEIRRFHEGLDALARRRPLAAAFAADRARFATALTAAYAADAGESRPRHAV